MPSTPIAMNFVKEDVCAWLGSAPSKKVALVGEAEAAANGFFDAFNRDVVDALAADGES